MARIWKRLKGEEGFTLIELMIVVVVIGILAGIAVPMYRGVQDKAKEEVGKANAQMLNQGIEMWVLSEGKEADYKYDENDEAELLKSLGLEGPVLHVKFDGQRYKAQPDAQIPVKPESGS